MVPGSPNEVSGWVQLSANAGIQNVTLEIAEAGIKRSLTTDTDGHIAFRFPPHLDVVVTPENPKLYEVVFNTPSRHVRDLIGFRTVEVRETQILLNGKPLAKSGLVRIDDDVPGPFGLTVVGFSEATAPSRIRCRRSIRHHGGPETRWSEEYQANLYVHQLNMLKNIPGLAGLSPWVLMDFHSPRRPLPGIQDYFNRKGVISNKGERKQAFYLLQKFYEQRQAVPRTTEDFRFSGFPPTKRARLSKPCLPEETPFVPGSYRSGFTVVSLPKLDAGSQVVVTDS